MKKTVMEISPEVIYMLDVMYSAVIRHTELIPQKMSDDPSVYNIVFFAILVKLNLGVLPLRFSYIGENFPTC